MGADMCGYQTMYPKEFTTNEKKKLHQHLKDVELLLKTPNLSELVAKEEDAHGEYVSKLNNLIPSFTSDLDDQGFAEIPEEIEEYITEYLDLLPMGREFIESPAIEGRDCSWRFYKIMGRDFISMFAGEMSWGDEPEGLGYQSLKGLDKINLLGTIETLCTPQSQSLHFIKEE